MSPPLVRRLRPHLFVNFLRYQSSPRSFSILGTRLSSEEVTHDYEKRVAQLQQDGASLEHCYPRLPQGFDARRTAMADFRAALERLRPGETVQDGQEIVVAGRLHSVRTAGSKLIFADLHDGTHALQAVIQLKAVAASPAAFKRFARLARKGDHLAVTGRAHRTARGELSIAATALPTLLAPSLHQIPDALDDAETRARQRHVDMLVNPDTITPLLVRHHVDSYFNHFFSEQDFVKVSTPLLTASAGGAVARPFATVATELQDQVLHLRIAPELWLKRLVVGGMPRVYEIGPAFRNEGVDATHNPEFAICEFYEAYATLDGLMEKTEKLLGNTQAHLESLVQGRTLKHLPTLDTDLRGPYPRLEFLPTLEREMHAALPDLRGPTAASDLLALFASHSLPAPATPTLPRLLDALAGRFLEPLCDQPTFITHHPAAMSPLSKHFVCPTTGQTVAARAELFIKGREYANMYEEENSPFEQRRKFLEQQRQRDAGHPDASPAKGEKGKGGAAGGDDEAMQMDHGFVEALEWGLPPTGGWGCGIDRLVMLLSGRERIGEVLAFGTLRNVVGMGRGWGR